MNTADHILYLLKTRGPQTAQALASLLDLTSMGARRQLEAWQEKGLVACYDQADKIGRPSRHWQLTASGHARYPDRHGELTVQLIAQVRHLFGEQGLEKLISARELESEQQYKIALSKTSDLQQRIRVLRELRSAEGYMADVEAQDDGSFLLIENHCPICAAAKTCQNFCRSELEIFRQVLGADCKIDRSEHLLSGGRRCVYRIMAV